MVKDGDLAEVPAGSRRVVLLGASNVIRGISTVVEMAARAWGRPLDFLAALGHGRSYGMESRVLGRALPGILSCGLWQDLDKRQPAPTLTLITDVGNDLLYGASPEQLAGWIDTGLQRLAPQSDVIILTELPLASLSELGTKRFRLMRAILFPQSRLDLAEALRRAECVNASIQELADRYGAQLVKPDYHWYGFDPIHIKMRYWGVAWEKIFKNSFCQDLSADQAGSFRRWLRLRTMPPHSRKLLGVTQRRPQPAIALADGTRISFY